MMDDEGGEPKKNFHSFLIDPLIELMKDKLFSNLLIKVLEKINEIIKNKEIVHYILSFGYLIFLNQ